MQKAVDQHVDPQQLDFPLFQAIRSVGKGIIARLDAITQHIWATALEGKNALEGLGGNIMNALRRENSLSASPSPPYNPCKERVMTDRDRQFEREGLIVTLKKEQGRGYVAAYNPHDKQAGYGNPDGNADRAYNGALVGLQPIATGQVTEKALQKVAALTPDR